MLFQIPSTFHVKPVVFVLCLWPGVNSEGGTGSGDKETAPVYQPDAAAQCLGRDAAVKYVAPLAFSLTLPSGSSPTTLCYRQPAHLEARSHWAHSHPRTCAWRLTLICGKSQQQQTMSVLFIRGLDVPNSCTDFLQPRCSWCLTVCAVSVFFFLLLLLLLLLVYTFIIKKY